MNGKIDLKVIVIAIVVLIILGVAGVIVFKMFNNTPTEINPPDDPVVIDKMLSETIKIDSTTKKNSAERFQLNIVTPVFENLNDYSFQSRINREIEESVKGYIDEISLVAETSEISTVYKYVVSYDRYNNGDYISLVVSQNYQTGGIRSNAWKEVYNVDARNSKEIFLADIFEEDADYDTAILDEINRQAKEKNYEFVGNKDITNIPEKQKFYIKDGVLVIYFDPAEIAPYVYGELHFEMPFEFNKDEGYFKIK